MMSAASCMVVHSVLYTVYIILYLSSQGKRKCRGQGSEGLYMKFCLAFFLCTEIKHFTSRLKPFPMRIELDTLYALFQMFEDFSCVVCSLTLVNRR